MIEVDLSEIDLAFFKMWISFLDCSRVISIFG